MANHVVSGQLVPDAVSGHPALELANTRAGWGTAAPREYLVSYDALAVWAADVGLVSAYEARRLRAQARKERRTADVVVATTIAFREAWYAVATATHRGLDLPRRDLDVVGRAVATAAGVSRWDVRTDGRVLPDGGTLGTAGLRLPLHRAVAAAGDLLATGEVAHVGACAGRGCGWLFLDPAHRRHWCVMAICGNRAKARAFAERQRVAAGLP